MKSRFSSLDAIAMVSELQQLIGMRVAQVYDVDHKTYLFKLQGSEKKSILLIESGIRLHTTQYDWPKNVAPSGFSMKLRKHLRNKRLEHIYQIGVDRIVDLQFGSGEVAHHVILELFDKGNILLTDYTYTILNVLRPHKEGDKYRFAVREKYPADRARFKSDCPSEEFLMNILLPLSKGSSIKKALLPHLEYGPALLEHIIVMAGYSRNPIMGKDFLVSDIQHLAQYCLKAEEILCLAYSGCLKNGYIVQKKVERINQDDLLTSEEFHPYLFNQHLNGLFKKFDSFSLAVDDFFSNLESQKQELKANQITQEAMKKVERIREDQTSRLKELDLKQDKHKTRAELIMRNYEKIDAAIMAVRSALASQMSWPDIQNLVNEATSQNDPIASMIKSLKLETNHISVQLRDPCADPDDELSEMIVDIDLDLSAHANAKRYYVDKKSAAIKQQKTIESQEKALKSAHKKAMLVLKEVKTMTTISKARKTFWFEKFFWFISSQNFLVIGGRDQQQNEIIVKKYMREGDIYVHADIVGASSIIIKNPTGKPVPPKTLSEAGNMAVCYSVAWAAKVVCASWWVHANQVSKTAPTGEYLSTGSFMVRGKKNYLPQSQLAMGFAFLFKTDEESIERHKDERIVRPHDEEIKDEQLERITEEVGILELDISVSDSAASDSEESAYPDSDFKIAFSSTDMTLTIQGSGEEERHPNVDDDGKCEPISFGWQNPKSRRYKWTNKLQDNTPSDVELKKNSKDQCGFKRGQKSKLKKIKEKYKDQDEEEKELRMSILQSAGSKKKPKKKKNGGTNENKEEKKVVNTVKKTEVCTGNVELDEDNEPTCIATDLDMLPLLTGQPNPEDELIFAVPVIAPYSTLLNYKYKVKLIPGSSKRGKSAQTCLDIFLHTKECTQREKDLMRAVNHDSLTRNFPGKVKVSTPHIGKIRK